MYTGISPKPIHCLTSVIFVDSNFWHGWQYPKWKKKLTSNFWINKIESNRRRDRRNNRTLKKMGWRVIRIWEHQLKKHKGEIFLKKLL